MTASELSARLQELIAIHGDIDVTVCPSPDAEIQVAEAEYYPSGPLIKNAALDPSEDIPERILITGTAPGGETDLDLD